MEHDDLTERLQAQVNWHLARYLMAIRHDRKDMLMSASKEIRLLKARALTEHVTLLTAIHYRKDRDDDRVTQVLCCDFS